MRSECVCASALLVRIGGRAIEGTDASLQEWASPPAVGRLVLLHASNNIDWCITRFHCFRSWSSSGWCMHRHREAFILSIFSRCRFLSGFSIAINVCISSERSLKKEVESFNSNRIDVIQEYDQSFSVLFLCTKKSNILLIRMYTKWIVLHTTISHRFHILSRFSKFHSQNYKMFSANNHLLLYLWTARSWHILNPYFNT